MTIVATSVVIRRSYCSTTQSVRAVAPPLSPGSGINVGLRVAAPIPDGWARIRWWVFVRCSSSALALPARRSGMLLGRSGFAVTVVEHAGGQRTSGSPVDVRGPALAVIDGMNVLAAIRAAATRASRLVAVDDHGAVIGWIPTQSSRRAVEVPRNDLVAILAAAGREHAEFRYDDTVTALQGDGGGVEATFARGAAGRFDLVVGADGLHSTVRRLVFGPEERFVTHLGLYVATVDLGRASADLRAVLIHSAPGRAVVVHPTTGREGAAFFFRHPQLPADQARDPQRQKELLTAVFGSLGWRVPELLDHLRSAEDFYFDSVSRVRMRPWSHGRTVLVGDATNCVSLLGEGSSMAITGAATLAGSLTAKRTNPSAALQRYERIHRKRLLPHHIGAPFAGHLLIPATSTGIALRDALFRACTAAAATGDRIHAAARGRRTGRSAEPNRNT